MTTNDPSSDAARPPDSAAPPPADTAAPPADGEAAATDDLQARYLRLAADFENFRRRALKEAADRSRYAAESAALALLPVLDNLCRAVEHAPEDTAAELLDGLRHTVRQFEEALASVGVAAIDAVGRPFDPSVHEAVLGEESPEVTVDTVVHDLQRGYRLHDRVLRPSMVKVAHPAAAPTEA
jgi:molecular chaperone GrpE